MDPFMHVPVSVTPCTSVLQLPRDVALMANRLMQTTARCSRKVEAYKHVMKCFIVAIVDVAFRLHALFAELVETVTNFGTIRIAYITA